ncbi:C39 family peptidase [Streptomyces sp. NPDC059352]|uniref:C39 family peptidase n=1 Tax=Streptomyces sp. NPDC059352 TaxID=3346810 RepID=UPI0036A0E797
MTQYASPGLIAKIVYGSHDPGDDPRWVETGAVTREEYGRWCRHMCGMACLQMALLHRDGIAPNLFQLLAGAREAGAYVEQDDGDIKGLVYAPAVAWMRSTYGLGATVQPTLTVEELTGLLDAGRMVLASVSKDIRTPEDLQPSRRGGHLVLCRGRTPDGQIAFSNPSGHTPEALAPTLPVDRFAAFFGERGISLDLRPA